MDVRERSTKAACSICRLLLWFAGSVRHVNSTPLRFIRQFRHHLAFLSLCRGKSEELNCNFDFSFCLFLLRIVHCSSLLLSSFFYLKKSKPLLTSAEIWNYPRHLVQPKEECVAGEASFFIVVIKLGVSSSWIWCISLSWRSNTGGYVSLMHTFFGLFYFLL
jgi:hypothetical protein